MGAASGDTRLDDDRAAAWAGLAFPAKDVGKAHVAALATFGVDVGVVT